MNQRIRQLAEQAVNSIPDHVDFDIPDVFKQKFAKLIVKECAKIAEDTQKFYDEHNDSVVNTEIWTMIKLHFGVEE